jgi:hypothetical protein
MTIGVGSVIVMMSIVEGTRHRGVREYEQIGLNLIFVIHDRSKAQGEGKQQEYFVAFKLDDLTTLGRSFWLSISL